MIQDGRVQYIAGAFHLRTGCEVPSVFPLIANFGQRIQPCRK